MVKVHRITAEGYFVEDVLLEEDAPVPSDCVTVHPPDGLEWPQWDGAAWSDAGVPFTRAADGTLTFPEG